MAGIVTSGGDAPGIRWTRVSLILVAVVVLFIAGRMISDLLVSEFRIDLAAGNEPMVHRAVMTAASTYIIVMAIPFMPGAEIGISMLVVFGGKIAFLVYISTVASLLFAFTLGRALSVSYAGRASRFVGLNRVSTLMMRLAPLQPQQRLALLLEGAPGRSAQVLVRHRYVLLAVLLNIPGNIVVGGGGGIAIVAGMTRLFSPPLYFLTIALATAPVPLAVYLTG